MANEHRQTATCMGRAHNARHPRAANQPFPAADSWQPPAQPAGPRRGRNGDDRRHLEGTARARFRAQRALRGGRRQHPSIPGTGTAAGSARPEARTTHDGPWRHLPSRRAAPPAPAARHGHVGTVLLPFTLGSVLFSTPTARTASGTTADARRSTGWPIARSSTSAKPRTGRTGWRMRANRVSEPWRNLSGYHPPKLAANVAPTHPEPAPPTALISGSACAAATSSRERPAKRTGRAFREHPGGFGRMRGQAGHLSAERVLRTLHEREAYPRPRELADP